MRYVILALAFLGASSVTEASTPKVLKGLWRLSAMTMDGRSITCPGAFVLPPGTPDIVKQFAKCGANETLDLQIKKSQGRYHAEITPLIAALSPDGYWFADRILSGTPDEYIVFIDEALPEAPRAYVYTLSKDRKTLTVSLTMRVNDPSTGKLRSSLNSMIFERP